MNKIKVYYRLIKKLTLPVKTQVTKRYFTQIDTKIERERNYAYDNEKKFYFKNCKKQKYQRKTLEIEIIKPECAYNNYKLTYTQYWSSQI